MMNSPSRREVLAVAAATVSLPLIDSALGTLPSALAAGRGGNTTASAPAEVPGFFATTFKPADLKDNEFTAIPGHAIVLSRKGKTVAAISTKCTHRGCTIDPKAGKNVLACQCHGAQYNLDGTVAKAPATKALDRYALRVNDKGLIEVDPGQKVAADDKNATFTIS
jgi:cytochrome b6-f complex iron-sulfur subunit